MGALRGGIGSSSKNKRQKEMIASAANRTRGPSMATMDFTTKPLMPKDYHEPDLNRIELRRPDSNRQSPEFGNPQSGTSRNLAP
ncbi:hypothetical protein GGR56DRAFT_559791 [Xylariaceae sp. FL0804]|nr:hypothetical protein GGR56DRAFT_559791 [Xylariaceae sp. FL0804]